MITEGTAKKLEKFLQSTSLQERFLKAVLKADPYEILWPDEKPSRFGRTFTHRENGKSVVYPLADDHIKLQALDFRLKKSQADSKYTVSPAITYYYLRKFENELLKKAVYKRALKSVSKKTAKKKAAKKRAKKKVPAKGDNLFPGDRQILAKDVLEKLAGIQKKIKVPIALKREKDEKSLLSRVLEEEKKLHVRYTQTAADLDSCRVELSYFRNPDFIHSKHRKKIDELQAQVYEYEDALKREASRADLLEKEVNRLAEQIISDSYGGTRPARDDSAHEELESVRKEYLILSQKYDALVSKNIDLVNRIEKEKSSRTLESALDAIRDKINFALKSASPGEKKEDAALLRTLQAEIGQIQRARVYLGRALFDAGILYLRLGDKNRAREELRAARELGIEDPETNRILNKAE